MKSFISPHRRLQLALGAFSCLVLATASAAEPGPTSNTTSLASAEATPSATSSTAAKLPYGVSDVVKLSQAQVSENVILSYVQNSGTVYNLSPQDIVTVRNEGVSDSVINAMLNQKKVTELAQNNTAPAPVYTAPAPVSTATPSAPASSPESAPPPDNAQAPPAAVQAPLVPTPSSSAYAIPYAPSGYAYYGYPYYAPYYGGYWGPGITFAFGFGHGYGYGYHGYHGGYHGYGGHWGGGHHR